MSVPLITDAVVINLSPDTYSVRVTLPSVQNLTVDVAVLIHGAADGYGATLKQLPKKGTAGLVMFPFGSATNGIWMGSYYAIGADAITTSTSDIFADYESYFGGGFRYIDSSGNCTEYFPDGSFTQVGDSTELPTIYRHTINPETAKRERKELTPKERTASKVAPKQIITSHVSGTQSLIDKDGNVSISVAKGKTFTLECNGVKIEVDTEGHVSIGSKEISDSLVLVSKLLEYITRHDHIDSTGGTTTPPVQYADKQTFESTRISIDK